MAHELDVLKLIAFIGVFVVGFYWFVAGMIVSRNLEERPNEHDYY